MWLGDAPDPARQTTLLYRNPQASFAVRAGNVAYLTANAGTPPAVQDIVVPADGFYTIGFQAFSRLAVPITGNGTLLLVDDLVVDDATPTATRAPTWAAALRPLPNPSADGRFELTLPGPASAGP